MQSVFIRHNCSSTERVLKQLWDQRLVALHYNDDSSVEPADYYPAGRTALKRMWSYCEEGALVGADFRKLNRAKMLVGKIEPGSRIVAKTFTDEVTGESFTYKVVQLTNAVTVDYTDYPLLVGIQPRQATLTGWPSARLVLEAALTQSALPRNASTLHPSQLEVLCYEWLRSTDALERLVLPIGRGLIDIDILGTNSKGGQVIAQVTHSNNPHELLDKENRLLEHARVEDDIYFFLPEKAPLAQRDEIKQITFKQVLTDLEMHTDSATHAMLRRMFAEHTASTKRINKR